MHKEFSLIEITDDRPIKEWALELMGARNAEAQVAFEKELLNEETVFYLELNEKKYLAFFIDGEGVPADLSFDVNKKHREIVQSVRVKRTDGELLYSFERGRKND